MGIWEFLMIIILLLIHVAIIWGVTAILRGATRMSQNEKQKLKDEIIEELQRPGDEGFEERAGR
ncbi:hypothetical protein L1O03_11445 [Corynebacterium uropygiale]|uniref:Uncharacterized protein n=1 Tax=Corynebacterium uropygiale TaxID=1775911 RepID=A0A9X1QR37_9CORY|nr:hypothetical protein [Corynebacterium uropygiale]MCF4007779.1 hypothetical protein [Corynebacterium uropygiale]